MHISYKLGGYVIRHNTEQERLVIQAKEISKSEQERLEIQAKEISKSKVIIDPEWEGSHHE